ncbi:MAG: hypothetical protein KF880_09455, partial [Ferruginibacter sp.]|nr:hypothetical protein [Ferruginibacter sp.]
MSRFKKVRNHEELNALIDTITKNKKILKNRVDEEVFGKETAKQETAKTQAPVVAELQNVIKKIDTVLQPAITNAITDTSQQTQNILNQLLTTINNNTTLFKKIRRSVIHYGNQIGNEIIDSNTALKNEITVLSQQLGYDGNTTTLAASIGAIADMLNTSPDNVISLMKQNITTSQQIITAIGGLKASAGPSIIPSSQQQPPSSGSTPVSTSQILNQINQLQPVPVITTTTNTTNTKTLTTTTTTGPAVTPTGVDANAPTTSTSTATQVDVDEQAIRAEEQLQKI